MSHRTDSESKEGSAQQPEEEQGTVAGTQGAGAAPLEEEGPQEDAENAKILDEMKKQREKYEEMNDRYLRTLAEYDNFRKRSQREKEAVYPTAVADTVGKFLPVVDAFERAVACECSDAEFKKGVDMIFDALTKTLEALDISEIGAVGETFDANLHNAVMHIEDEELEKNVLASVLQKGYRIGDRVLRYAMVTVAN